MKNVLIGCGVVLALVIIVVVVLGYFGFKVFKGVGEEVQQVQEGFAKLDSMYVFVAPQDGLITSRQYDKWIQIRQHMAPSIASFDTIVENFSFKTLSRLKEHSMTMMLRMHSELETAQISPEEYTWVSRQIIGALNSGDVRANPAMQDIVEAYDEMNQPSKSKQYRSDIRTMGIPVTSYQIQRISGLIQKNPTVFLETIKVFYVDTLIYGFSHRSRIEAVDDSTQTACLAHWNFYPVC